MAEILIREYEEVYSACMRCFHCHEPLLPAIGRFIPGQGLIEVSWQGKIHLFHNDCWTAREIANKLKGGGGDFELTFSDRSIVDKNYIDGK